MNLIFLVAMVFANEADLQSIAKKIQCGHLREKSFQDTFERISVEKVNSEYIKKVSDGIYAQAFKICDPDNSANAEKEIETACVSGCDQAVTKGVMGIGGVGTTDVERCKKGCLVYSDLLGLNYTSAVKGMTKYIEKNPPKKEAPKAEAAPVVPETAPTSEVKTE